MWEECPDLVAGLSPEVGKQERANRESQESRSCGPSGSHAASAPSGLSGPTECSHLLKNPPPVRQLHLDKALGGAVADGEVLPGPVRSPGWNHSRFRLRGWFPVTPSFQSLRDACSCAGFPSGARAWNPAFLDLISFL